MITPIVSTFRATTRTWYTCLLFTRIHVQGQHENVVHVREIVVGSNMDKIYIVMDYVEHDLKALMENMKEPFLIGEVGTRLLSFGI